LTTSDFYLCASVVVLASISKRLGFHLHYPFVPRGNNVSGKD
jgi:hypothetical protein